MRGVKSQRIAQHERKMRLKNTEYLCKLHMCKLRYQLKVGKITQKEYQTERNTFWNRVLQDKLDQQVRLNDYQIPS